MTTRGIDFAALSLMDALDLAILIEDEAKERYEEFADQMALHDTPDAAVFFRFMASNECKHGADLAARRMQLFGYAPRSVTRAMLWDVEAPEYDEVRAFMTPRHAMQAALRCEQKAHAYFASTLPQVRDAQVKALFEELKNEEVHHQDLVRRELAKLPPDTEINPQDFVDEPVAQ